MRFLRTPICFRRTAAPTPEPGGCGVPAPAVDSPLRVELGALRDHAQRLRWLADREAIPGEYRQCAQEVVGELLAGWRLQRTGGVLADLAPRCSSGIEAVPPVGGQ